MLLILQLAFAGLATGGAYALSSIGMVTIYKGTRVINIAQGAIGMIGTFVFANWVAAGKNYAIGMVLGIGTSIIVGLIVYLGVMLPLRRAAGVARMIASFGVVLLLEGAAQLRWGINPEEVKGILNGSDLHILGIYFGQQAILTFAVAVGAAILLTVFYTQTKIGRKTEAAAANPDGTARLGYSPTQLGILTWAIGSALAGLAGILIVPGLGLNTTSLTLVVISAMIAALVGSLQRIWPALIAAFAIGIIQAIIDGKTSIIGVDQAVPLAAVIVFLLVGAEVVPSRGLEREYRPLVPRQRMSVISLTALAAAACVSVVLFNSYWQALIVEGAGLAIVCLSLVLVLGYLGQISLMQWALAGVAAFTAVGLAVDHGWGFLPGLVVGALCAGVVAVIIGVPALRLRGVTLVIVTLAASITLQQLVFNQFGGGSGYVAPVASLFGLHMVGRTFSVVALILLVVLCIAMYALRRSTLGKRLLAIRASERAAAASGVRTVLMKTAVFGLGGVLAGVGGVVWGYATGAVQAGSFDPITALEIVAFLYINGVGSIGAGVVAGFAIAMGQPFLTNILHVNGSGVFDIIAGVGLIYTLIVHPDGALVHRKRQGPRSGLIARGTELLGRARGGVPEPTVTGALLVRASREEDRAEG